MKKLGLFLIGLIFFILVPRVSAGGGLNAILDPTWAVGFTGDEGMKISAVVYNDSIPAPHNQGFVVGKEFVFEIENSDPAYIQSCKTIQPVSDAQGKVEGVCFAKKAGFLRVYLRDASSNRRTVSATMKFIYPPGKNPSINAIESTPTKTVPNELTPTPTVLVVQNTAETDKKIEGLENQVKLLTKSLENQNKELNALQRLLEHIISLLEKIPFFNRFQTKK